MYKIEEIKVVSLSVREFTENRLSGPAEVAALWRETVAQAKQYDPEKEHFATYILNARNRVKSWQIVGQGIADACLIHPREVFRPAIVAAGSAVIVAHNHPSGDTRPSPEDLRVTRQLIETGKIIGIQVLDHVIIGDTFYSIREAGSVSFE